MKQRLAIVLAALGVSAAAEERSTIWNTHNIHWQQINSDGSKYSVLEGDRSKPGPFTYAFFLPDGVWVGPHRHTGAARVFVLSGTLLLGDGVTMNRADARAISAREGSSWFRGRRSIGKAPGGIP